MWFIIFLIFGVGLLSILCITPNINLLRFISLFLIIIVFSIVGTVINNKCVDNLFIDKEIKELT
jgi:hypothetical protein